MDVINVPIRPPRGKKVYPKRMICETVEQNCWNIDEEKLEPLISSTTIENIYSIQITYDENLTKKCENYLKDESVLCDEKNVVFVEKIKKIKKKENNKIQKKKFFNFCPWKIPWIIISQSIVQIFVFIYGEQKTFDFLVFSPYKKNEIWRYFTYNFLHNNKLHLLLNVVIQILFALPLETEQGHLKVLIIYYGGIFGGAIGVIIFQPLKTIGSSSGVYSLLMSHLSHTTLNFPKYSYRYFRIFSVFFILFCDVLHIIIHFVVNNNKNPIISISGHSAGAISGILLGFIFYTGTLSELKIFRALKYTSLVLYFGFIFTVIFTVIISLK